MELGRERRESLRLKDHSGKRPYTIYIRCPSIRISFGEWWFTTSRFCAAPEDGATRCLRGVKNELKAVRAWWEKKVRTRTNAPGGCGIGFWGRPVSESGRLRQGDGTRGGGARRRAPERVDVAYPRLILWGQDSSPASPAPGATLPGCPATTLAWPRNGWGYSGRSCRSFPEWPCSGIRPAQLPSYSPERPKPRPGR